MTSEDKELITLDATKTTLLSSSPEFEAWVASLDPKHWAKYDLGACRLGWEAGRASLTDALATIVLLQSQYRKQQDHDTAVIKRLEQVRDGAIAANKATAAAIEAEVSRLRAENEKMREALEQARIWHEEQDESLSKQPPSHGPNGTQWARMHHREQIDEISAALEGKDE